MLGFGGLGGKYSFAKVWFDQTILIKNKQIRALETTFLGVFMAINIWISRKIYFFIVVLYYYQRKEPMTD